MEELLFNFYAEGNQRRLISPGRACFYLNGAEFASFSEPSEHRSLNRLTTALIGLVRQSDVGNFGLENKTAVYMIGDDADPVVPDDACAAASDEQQLLRLLRKISPVKEVGVQASMCAARLGAELGARGKVWAINPSRHSIGLLLDDYRLSIQEGSATNAVICVGITFSSSCEHWPPGEELREVVRVIGVDGWNDDLERRLKEMLNADLIRTGGKYE